MHISPTIHYNAGRNYKINTHYADEFVTWNTFSPWEDFFVNPFSSDVISPNQLRMYVYMYIRISVQVQVEAHNGTTKFCFWEVYLFP